MMTQNFLSNPDHELNLSTPLNTSNERQEGRQRIKHFLVGDPTVVQRTIRSLHVLGYSEVREWSQLQPARDLGEVGEVVSVLIRYVVSDT